MNRKYLKSGLLLLILSLSSFADNREIMIIESQKENVTAFSGGTRNYSREIIRSIVEKTDSKETLIHAIDVLQEATLSFSGTTSREAQNLIQNIANKTEDSEIKVRAIQALEGATTFTFKGSAAVRVHAAKIIFSIAEQDQSSEVVDAALNVAVSLSDSYLGTLKKISSKFIENIQ